MEHPSHETERSLGPPMEPSHAILKPPSPPPGFWGLAHQVILSPLAAFSPERLASMKRPRLFMLWWLSVSLIFGRLWGLGFDLLRGESAPWAGSAAGAAGELAGKPLILALLLVVAAGTLSSFLDRGLWLVGMRREKRLSLRILCLASAASLAALIPVVGIPLALVWGFVLCWIGFRVGYEIGWFRLLLALIVSLGMLALLLALPIILVVALLWPPLGFMARLPGF